MFSGGHSSCPTCQEPADESTLIVNPTAATMIGTLRLRCKHGLHGQELLPNLPQLEPTESTDGPETDDAGGVLLCDWRGRVCELSAHLAVCGYEPVKCSGSTESAGCKGWVLRKDAASRCLHCRRRYEAFAMGHHERLGTRSRVLNLDAGVVRMILEQKGEEEEEEEDGEVGV